MPLDCKLNEKKGEATADAQAGILPKAGETADKAKQRATEEAQEKANRKAIAAAKRAVLSLLKDEECKSDCPALLLIKAKEPRAEKAGEPKKKGDAMEAYAKAAWEAPILCVPRTVLEKMIDKVGSGGNGCKVVNRSGDIDQSGTGPSREKAKEDARKKASDVVSAIKQKMDSAIKDCSKDCPIVISMWKDETGAPSDPPEHFPPFTSKVSGRVTAIYGCLPAIAIPKVGDFMKENGKIGEEERKKWFVLSMKSGR